MKTLSFALVAGLALASPFAARAEISAQASLETYYTNPQPAELPRLVQALSREGYFEKPGHTAVAIGFLATLFARNPERVDAWLLGFNGLPLAHHRLIAAALWQAGNPLGADMLRHLGEFTPVRNEVARLADTPSIDVANTPVLSPSSMNLQWGAFLATGDERYIVNILDALGTDRPGLDSAARYALAQDAAAHPRVFEICRAQLDKQPAEAKDVLRAALNEAAARTGRPAI
ncbi:MAG TPA: hypothetical protein VG838_12820 [Opitutaceae bacterium]|nr:hypothetical protein [Opitutaceae bacterium]